MARDGKQIAAKARGLAEAVAALDAGQKGALDQVLDPELRLVAKEAAELREVPAKQDAAGSRVAASPGVEQLEIGGRARVHGGGRW